jgi:hypothetical protein
MPNAAAAAAAAAMLMMTVLMSMTPMGMDSIVATLVLVCKPMEIHLKAAIAAMIRLGIDMGSMLTT